MGFIEKLETLINSLLIRIGTSIVRSTPRILKRFVKKLIIKYLRLLSFFRRLPSLGLQVSKDSFKKFLAKSKEVDLNSKVSVLFQELKDKNSTKNKIKNFFLYPFNISARWLQDLSPVQSILLLTFTAGSILAVIGIGFSGKKLVNNHWGTGRVPASEESFTFDRPDYYKKERRYATIRNLRLPVYFAEINEVKSVDIDFIVTLTNRSSRMFLEKHDLQLRDHLILQIEPTVASFPIENEGKEIIKNKLYEVINEFLRKHEIEGNVEEVNLTYVLAN